MSDPVVEGIISADRLRKWAQTYHSGGSGMDDPILREAKVHLDEDGFHITAVDAANVALFAPTKMGTGAFEHYDAPGQAVIGLSFPKVIDRLAPASNDDLVEFELDMEQRKFNIHYGSTDMSLALIDPDQVRSEPDIPNLDLPNTVQLSGGQLRHVVSVADMISDHLRIEGDIDAGTVTFGAEGDVDDATVSYGAANVESAEITANVMSKFSVGYIDALTRPMPADASVTLKFGEEHPIKLSWDRFDGHFTINQTLAPRIDT